MLLVSACGSDGPTATMQTRALSRSAPSAATPAPSAGTTAHVDIVDFDYSPRRLVVSAGAVVSFTNRDRSNHTVTFDATGTDLGNQPKGKTVRRTFPRAGTFAYHCDFHPNMHGTVVVR
jgi:plastocyanin